MAALLEVLIMTVDTQTKLYKGVMLKNQNFVTSQKMNQRGSYGKKSKLIKAWMGLLSQITKLYDVIILNMEKLFMLHQFQLCL